MIARFRNRNDLRLGHAVFISQSNSSAIFTTLSSPCWPIRWTQSITSIYTVPSVLTLRHGEA